MECTSIALLTLLPKPNSCVGIGAAVVCADGYSQHSSAFTRLTNLGIRKESKQRRIIKNTPMKSLSQRFLLLSSQLFLK